MRGETSDVIEGEAVEGSGGDIGKSTNTTHSPPLSAAASQVSLATSDLTTSDPDLALTSSASSVTSSRPPSSSDVISPDLGLPNVDDYTTETVDCPQSPLPQTEDGFKTSGVCFAPDINVLGEESTENISVNNDFSTEFDPDRPGSIDLNGDGGQRKLISVTKDILNSPADGDDISISSVCSDGILHEDTFESIGDEISRTSGDNFGINSPRLSSQGSDGCQHSSPDSQSYEEPSLPPSPYKTCEEDPIPSLPPFIPELSALEESMEDRHWRSVVVGGVWRRIDMNVIAPYRKCLHHGGYMSENHQAIIVFSSCYLPNSSRRDYNYVMDNLFLYVLSTLEQLVADDYVLIYLAGGCPKNSVPSFKWLKRAYQMIDHKLRKNLQALHVVHPTMWVKTIVALTRPFVSSKFYRKLSFINNLTELAQVVPLDQLEIPDTVQHVLQTDGKSDTGSTDLLLF